ncbi:MAG TPA: hypothetical protein ENJ08_10950 [Gammaproteobacteria bacterium]|nr:hypothetical protein [Gammaproteobacteria bacterium]
MSKEVYRTRDAQGEIIVRESAGRRIMDFGSGLEQSNLLMNRPWQLTHEYTKIMLLGLVFNNARHITLAGLGGGGLLHCIAHFFPQIEIQVVELRQAVIDVACEWFDLPRESCINIACCDAYVYLKEQRSEKTDLILSDLYNATQMSDVQAQRRFIEVAHASLNEEGWLVINFHQLPDSDSEVMQQIRAMFAVVYVYDVSVGNRILFCGKGSEEDEWGIVLDRYSAQARELGRALGLPLLYYFRLLRAANI